ncbi:Universal stress protein family protein [Actinokineospora alba]|uniref:Universal stress protein family protein n=1 Tax=Actinokineospora alba TaxID=504798 RepID=A0A1H0FNY2_9PSEU|nr:universal stress protein [Actinokineospora alba]TDP69556.1 universal stress protein family protein [Actinokineospora alba]SDI14222.1 Universal stress protein family protein [Actinokineospora alba]SDN96398.1 Universal stress protein family protein [Actinokineospora alba]
MTPIVVGVDGSDAGQAALSWAFAEARGRGCAVHAVNVWSLGTVHDFFWASRRSLRAQSQSLLRAATRGRGADMAVECHSPEGAVGPTLVAAAAGAAVLVLGTRDRVRSRAVIDYCLRHSSVPVVVIRVGQVHSEPLAAGLAGPGQA